MVWTDTQKFKNRSKENAKGPHDIEKLEQWKKEGWKPKFVNVPKFVTRFIYSRAVKLVVGINPADILYTVCSGNNCQNCGLFNRHPFCSPDSPTYTDAKEIVGTYKNAILFITQNDGNDPWADDPTELSHIKFQNKQSFGLKGAEAGTSRYLQRRMKRLEMHARRIGLRAQAFISGHCELCGKCPVKGLRDAGNRQVSCPLGGLPSLETWWMDIYRWYTHGTLGDIFKSNVDVLRPLTFVCKDYFTLITMLAFDSTGNSEYWYQENYKKRLKDPSVREQYKAAKSDIARAVKNRKEKGLI